MLQPGQPACEESWRGYLYLLHHGGGHVWGKIQESCILLSVKTHVAGGLRADLVMSLESKLLELGEMMRASRNAFCGRAELFVGHHRPATAHEWMEGKAQYALSM
jgi:hypothetical protein